MFLKIVESTRRIQRFCFGMGIERIMLLSNSDIRMFYENDVRFLEQFKASI
jgi:phenylalanyl-tRNA synthetase alpha chain